MTGSPPVFITRAQLGKGPGIVLISFAAPGGELGKGQVENVEVARIAMTHSTFKEIANLFNFTLGELGLSEPGAPPLTGETPQKMDQDNHHSEKNGSINKRHLT